MPLNMSELGLNIIQFISNPYVGVLCPTLLCWKKIVTVTPSLTSHLVMHSDDLAPRLIQSISRDGWNVLKCQKMEERDGHGQTCLEMVWNDQKWLEMAENVFKKLKIAGIVKIALKNAWKCLQQLKLAGKRWKRLEVARRTGNGWNGWKWLDIAITARTC